MKHDRLICLASAHAKLKAAADLVRWSMSGVSDGIIPRKEVEAIITQLQELSSKAFDEMRKP